MPSPEFTCPWCAGQISRNTCALECADCGIAYPIRNGIVDFRGEIRPSQFAPAGSDKVGEVASEIRQGTSSDVRCLHDGPTAGFTRLHNTSGDERYPWTLLLRLPPAARVLDLDGSGGVLAENIAPGASHVYVVARDLQQLECARLHLARVGCNARIDLLLVGGGTRLPFSDHSLDCVVARGFSAQAFQSENIDAPTGRSLFDAVKLLFANPATSDARGPQMRLLAELGRILKPDGQLVLTVANRFEYGYLRGRRDPCSGLPFTSLLPRALATACSVIVNHRPYQACTRSIKEYRRLLRKANYERTETCGLTPDCRRPTELIPFGADGRLWRVSPSRGLDRIRHNRQFVPSYAIIASQKRVSRPSLAELIASEVETKLGVERGSAIFSRLQITSKRKNIINVSIGGVPMIIKVSFTGEAEDGSRRNYEFIEKIVQAGMLRGLAPRPIANGAFRGIGYYAETRADGRSLGASFDSANHARYLGTVSRALRAVTPDIEQRAPEPFAGDAYRRQVLEPLDRIGYVLDEPRLVDEVRAHFHRRLHSLPVRHGLVHGDFCASNILVSGVKVTGIIDWEDACEVGIPALDALNYVESVRRRFCHGTGPVEVLSQLARWDALEEEYRRFLAEHYRRCGIDPACHRPLVYLYWVRHVADQLGGGLADDPSALETRVTRVLERFVGEPCP